MSAWRQAGLNYINYSNIAAKILRRALKPELRTEALRRDESHVRITPWANGKPALILGQRALSQEVTNATEATTVAPARTNENTTDAAPVRSQDNNVANGLSDWTSWCKHQPDTYVCDPKLGSRPRYYYDVQLEDCTTFKFGNCPNSHNQFATYEDCHEICREPGSEEISVNVTLATICRLQPDFGECDEYHPMFYYDLSKTSCLGFSYSGCEGNANRFDTMLACEETCGAIVIHDT